MKDHPQRDLFLIKAAGCLRSLGVGLLGVLFGIYLYRRNLSSFEIGMVIAAGLAGSALATMVVSYAGDHLGRRRVLMVLSLLGGVGGIALVLSPGLPVLLLMVLVGMVNGTGTDRSASFALDQAVIPGLAPDVRRTWNLAWYNVLLDAGGSLGALGAGLPLLLQHSLSLSLLGSYRVVFLGYCRGHPVRASFSSC
jgi:MFS family permease